MFYLIKYFYDFTKNRVMKEGWKDSLDALKAVHVGRHHSGVPLGLAVDFVKINGLLKIKFYKV